PEQHPLAPAAADERGAEARELERRAELDVDRAAGPQPARDAPEQAGRGERDAVARRDEAGVAVRALCTRRVARLEDRDVGAAPSELERSGHADPPAADDEDVRALVRQLAHLWSV